MENNSVHNSRKIPPMTHFSVHLEIGSCPSKDHSHDLLSPMQTRFLHKVDFLRRSVTSWNQCHIHRINHLPSGNEENIASLRSYI